MEIIAHKINSIKSLKKLPKKYGSEVDLRTFGSKIILSHDPYLKGDKFEDYLENYNHGTLILNKSSIVILSNVGWPIFVEFEEKDA